MSDFRPAGHGPARGQCDCGWVNEEDTDDAWVAHVCADYTLERWLDTYPDYVPVIAAALRVLDTDPSQLGYFAGKWVFGQMFGQPHPHNLQMLERAGIIVQLHDENSSGLTCYRFSDEDTARRVMAARI